MAEGPRDALVRRNSATTKVFHLETRVPGLLCGIICVILRLAVFTARRYAKRGICRRRVSVCLCVCVSVCLCVRHTPVLYQNG